MSILLGSRFLPPQMLQQHPRPPQPFKAACSALPLLHVNCPLPQTPPQSRVSSTGHLHLAAPFLNPSPVRLAKPEQQPSESWGEPAGCWVAEGRAPETPSSWNYAAVMMPGVGMKVEPAEMCQEGILTMKRKQKIPRQSVCGCSNQFVYVAQMF